METFAVPKELVKNPHYKDQRQKSLAGLSDGIIDVPIIELNKAFNKLPYCFTLQSCYGHFICSGQNDSQNGSRIEAFPKGVLDIKETIDYFGRLKNDKKIRHGAIEIVYFKQVTLGKDYNFSHASHNPKKYCKKSYQPVSKCNLKKALLNKNGYGTYHCHDLRLGNPLRACDYT